MVEELEVLKDVAQKLKGCNIEYMMTGSMALSIYATPRMTRDIDIVIELDKSQIKIFIESFSNDYYVSEDSVISAVNRKAMFNLIHNENIIKIDFIVRKKSEYRKVEFDRRHLHKIEDSLVSVVSIEDLILSKIVWAKDSMSEFQFRDIRQLVKQDIDIEYLQLWAEKLDVFQILAKVINND